MIRYLIMDVDGTLTDGKIYIGSQGELMKAFSVKDGYVIRYILKPADIIPVILTARNSSIVEMRCQELGITEIYQGKVDKLSALKEIVGQNQLECCAYFGDDILDLKCMLPIKNAGGIVGCPADAVQEVKAVADYVCLSKAGEGALREFSEWLVNQSDKNECIQKRIEDAIEYLQKLQIKETDVGKKYEVSKDFYYVVQSYMTKPLEECKLESHRRYIDIQMMVYGEECMEIADISRLSVDVDYNQEKDVMYWNVPPHLMQMTLHVGDYIVLYPENAHRGATNIIKGASKRVVKIVGKLRI